MEDQSSTQSFANLHHHHRHRPSFPLTLPSLQAPEVGYPSSQSGQDSLEPCGSQREESTTSFLTSNPSSGARRGSSDRILLNSSTSSLDLNFGGHLDGNDGLGGHFVESWYTGSKKAEIWDDGESCESTTDEFHGKNGCYGDTNDAFYMMNCANEEEARCKVRPNYNNYTHVSCEAKSETVYDRDANISHFTKQTASYNRSGAGSFSDNNADYCRTDSRVSDDCFEDQLQSVEAEGPWFSPGDGKWRGSADSHSLTSGDLPQRSFFNSRTYTQKLDSFSDAFLSQKKRRFPLIPSVESSWEFAVGRGEPHALIKSRQSCAFDSDSYLPPSSTSSSPSHPSLPSFPSPPTSSHLMSSVLSPPPTPLPPPSHSPSKMDSPSAFSGHSVSQAGESLGILQFFASRLQPTPSVHSPGMMWKFPLLPHSFPQLSGDTECNQRSSHGEDYANVTASQDILQSPESSFSISSPHRPSIHPCRVLCSSSSPSPQTSFHLSSHTLQLSGQPEAADKIAPYIVPHKIKNGSTHVNLSLLQQQASPVYTGTPFPSILHSTKGQRKGHHTPRPLLNPLRKGTGLYSSLLSLHHREQGASHGEVESSESPHVNVGPDFQADLPPCFSDNEWWSPEEEPPRDQVLWKPWGELEENANLQDQVEKLLSMCSSSCIPGGGSNTELALHCLSYCQGNTVATLEMLLFSQPSPAGDYHYSGSDCWTDTEKNLFSAALRTCGKDFSLIQKMVKTKSVFQCVEFYYLSKKLMDKQTKQKEENKEGEREPPKSVTPISQPMERQFSLEEAVPVPPLASFFPCKLCGKMFYKIKSRNAHMKIHRQPQDDWADRRLQHQLLTQRLALTTSSNLLPNSGSNLLQAQTPVHTFPSRGNNSMENVHNNVTNSNPITPNNANDLDPALSYGNTTPQNPHVITSVDNSTPKEPGTVLPFLQSWGSFGLHVDQTTFYCQPEGKEDVGAGTTGGKEPMNWQ